MLTALLGAWWRVSLALGGQERELVCKVALTALGHAFPRAFLWMLSLVVSLSNMGGWGPPMHTQMGKGGFEFGVVLPYLIRNYCHFIIISGHGNGFVVVFKRERKTEPLSKKVHIEVFTDEMIRRKGST